MQVLKKINWFHPDGLPIVIVRRDPPEPFGLHSHEFSEIVIIMGGKGGLMKKFGSSWILVARVRFDFGLSTSEQGGGFLEASAPASNDLAADVETWYSRKCQEKPTQALRGRNLGRDIPVDSAPMVRAVSTNVAPPRLIFGLPLDAGVDASKTPPILDRCH